MKEIDLECVRDIHSTKHICLTLLFNNSYSYFERLFDIIYTRSVQLQEFFSLSDLLSFLCWVYAVNSVEGMIIESFKYSSYIHTHHISYNIETLQLQLPALRGQSANFCFACFSFLFFFWLNDKPYVTLYRTGIYFYFIFIGIL